LRLGAHQEIEGRNFVGSLDSVAIWDGALDPDEVQSVLSAVSDCR